MPSRFAVKQWLRRLRRSAANALRRLADWLDRPILTPMEVPTFTRTEEVIPVSPGARHALEKWERGGWRVVRPYKNGGEGRDAYLAKKLSKTPGRWGFSTDRVIRDEFSN